MTLFVPNSQCLVWPFSQLSYNLQGEIGKLSHFLRFPRICLPIFCKEARNSLRLYPGRNNTRQSVNYGMASLFRIKFNIDRLLYFGKVSVQKEIMKPKKLLKYSMSKSYESFSHARWRTWPVHSSNGKIRLTSSLLEHSDCKPGGKSVSITTLNNKTQWYPRVFARRKRLRSACKK